MEIIKQKLFNRLSLNQKILSLLVIEILGFMAVMFVAFSQVYTVGNETKQMSSITIPLIESVNTCLLYTSPSPRDATLSRMPSSA